MRINTKLNIILFLFFISLLIVLYIGLRAEAVVIEADYQLNRGYDIVRQLRLGGICNTTI